MVTAICKLGAERSTAYLSSKLKQKVLGVETCNERREEVLTKAHFQICSSPFLDLKIGDL